MNKLEATKADAGRVQLKWQAPIPKEYTNDKQEAIELFAI